MNVNLLFIMLQDFIQLSQWCSLAKNYYVLKTFSCVRGGFIMFLSKFQVVQT